ncbi:beta-ketoacyl-ACP synthase I [Chromobacterium alkanivorans]|uniref:beta-ketoacyl synthase N-terminal-like domain-containing protein n=1 Tax=Chromobacterium alkanivorans TaxID=1071719 RepID=UPI001967DABC|nr:beta-ketoacyl synthase N-terminal-like domain-containing protein [Chromobacterium alkanivorans]MBN3005044.1 beta-ketoacyl-ACP synthase I [Chromobacterium alkanivorans]
MKRRVVVSGYGLASPIGNDEATALAALRDGRSGIAARPDFAEQGMSSRVAGAPRRDDIALPPRKLQRFMADAALYGWHAAQQAIAQARLPASVLRHPRTGLVVGSGVGSAARLSEAMAILASRGIQRLTPYYVPQIMGNTVSANLATHLGIQGLSLGVTSACATSAHAIGYAFEQIQFGKQDVMLAGGAEEVSWQSAVLFDVMGVLAAGDAAAPEASSRPYHADRDGFVIAGGAGVLVLEALEHALVRKAPIIAELAGYAAGSDGHSMVAPSGAGAERCMRLALADAGLERVDYINTHATGTQQGDRVEVEAVQAVFGADAVPAFSSTKGLTGHAIAAAGAMEAIFSLQMMSHGFVAGSPQYGALDDCLAGLPLVRRVRAARLDSVLCNSFGFGGANACLVFSRAAL